MSDSTVPKGPHRRPTIHAASAGASTEAPETFSEDRSVYAQDPVRQAAIAAHEKRIARALRRKGSK